MALWSRFRKLQSGWQGVIALIALIAFPVTFLSSPIIAFFLPEKRSHKLVAVLCSLPLFFLVVWMGNNPPRLEAEKEPFLVRNVPTETSERLLPDTPYERIQALVQKQGGNVEVFDNNNGTTQPPFDVLVTANATSCNAAKLRAWDITRDLYRDSVTAPTIGRVKVMVTGYVTTSLGSTGAALMNEETWKVGSSIFFKAVQAESKYEMYSDEGKPLGALTFGVEQEGCRE